MSLNICGSKCVTLEGLETAMLTDIWKVLSRKSGMLTHICVGFLPDQTCL
jgi:hypothetical protein